MYSLTPKNVIIEKQRRIKCSLYPYLRYVKILLTKYAKKSINFKPLFLI